MTLVASKVLSKTLLKGMPSSFTLELPPYRRPQIGKVIIRSVCDRTLFVLGRAIPCRSADLDDSKHHRRRHRRLKSLCKLSRPLCQTFGPGRSNFNGFPPGNACQRNRDSHYVDDLPGKRKSARDGGPEPHAPTARGQRLDLDYRCKHCVILADALALWDYSYDHPQRDTESEMDLRLHLSTHTDGNEPVLLIHSLCSLPDGGSLIFPSKSQPKKRLPGQTEAPLSYYNLNLVNCLIGADIYTVPTL